MIEELKNEVYRQNLRLVNEHLVVLTWGNVSAIDRERGFVVIKPSGVDYAKMRVEDMVVVDLDGNTVEGRLRPSSDLATHLALYKAFPEIGGVVHTHSPEATARAQSGREIPCYGTTHADCFAGSVPMTRLLTAEEVAENYEGNTGKVIIERFAGVDPLHFPGVLVLGHGPFTWGKTAAKAVDVAVSLEEIARMARYTETISAGANAGQLPQYVLNKHFERKHGKNAYYGQGGN